METETDENAEDVTKTVVDETIQREDGEIMASHTEIHQINEMRGERLERELEM